MNPRNRGDGWTSGPAVVALGGGHGLAATLRALRRVTDSVTAVVSPSNVEVAVVPSTPQPCSVTVNRGPLEPGPPSIASRASGRIVKSTSTPATTNSWSPSLPRSKMRDSQRAVGTDPDALHAKNGGKSPGPAGVMTSPQAAGAGHQYDQMGTPPERASSMRAMTWWRSLASSARMTPSTVPVVGAAPR